MESGFTEHRDSLGSLLQGKVHKNMNANLGRGPWKGANKRGSCSLSIFSVMENLPPEKPHVILIRLLYSLHGAKGIKQLKMTNH